MTRIMFLYLGLDSNRLTLKFHLFDSLRICCTTNRTANLQQIEQVDFELYAKLPTVEIVTQMASDLCNTKLSFLCIRSNLNVIVYLNIAYQFIFAFNYQPLG
jgi:hypothetical protein